MKKDNLKNKNNPFIMSCLSGGRRGIRTPRTEVVIPDADQSALRPSSHRTTLYHKNKNKGTPLREFRDPERILSRNWDYHNLIITHLQLLSSWMWIK